MNSSVLKPGAQYRYDRKSERVPLLPWWLTIPFLSMAGAFIAMPVFSNKFGILKLFRLGEHDWIATVAVIFIQIVIIFFVIRMLMKAYSVSGVYAVDGDHLVVRRLFGKKKYPLSSLQIVHDEQSPTELFGECERYSKNGSFIKIDPRYMQTIS